MLRRIEFFLQDIILVRVNKDKQAVLVHLHKVTNSFNWQCKRFYNKILVDTKNFAWTLTRCTIIVIKKIYVQNVPCIIVQLLSTWMTKTHSSDPFGSLWVFLSMVFKINIVNDKYERISIYRQESLQF